MYVHEPFTVIVEPSKLERARHEYDVIVTSTIIVACTIAITPTMAEQFNFNRHHPNQIVMVGWSGIEPESPAYKADALATVLPSDITSIISHMLTFCNSRCIIGVNIVGGVYMGMYTQVRGWLNVDSIAYGAAHFDHVQRTLRDAQDSYGDNAPGRSWVCRNTIAAQGGNGSIFLFFGTELKNYDDDAERWIEYLLQYFPGAEGRIDFQYEEENCDDTDSTSKYWLIRGGKVIERNRCKTWCKGYGNMLELEASE